MADARFYQSLGPVEAAVLAAGRTLHGDPAWRIEGAAAIAEAAARDVAYFDGRPDAAPSSGAGAVFVRPDAIDAFPQARARIVTPAPRAAFARALRMLFRERAFKSDERIDASASFEEQVEAGPGAVIGPDVAIGAGARIGANAVIGPGVTIGRRTRIAPGAVVMMSLVGDDVVVGANSVVGDNGFGVGVGPDGPLDLLHLGRVVLMDRVALGACVTVDRGLFADTIVGEGSHIDNHAQIAHNVRVGRGVMMAAFAGVSGSVSIGDGVVMGGRVGIGDHRTIGDGASIGAGSGVLRDVPSGEIWMGYPAKPLRAWQRELVWTERGARKKDGGR